MSSYLESLSIAGFVASAVGLIVAVRASKSDNRLAGAMIAWAALLLGGLLHVSLMKDEIINRMSQLEKHQELMLQRLGPEWPADDVAPRTTASDRNRENRDAHGRDLGASQPE